MAGAGTERPQSRNGVIVTSMGPLGHVYPPCPLSEDEKRRLAQELVLCAKVPLVFTAFGEDKAEAWTESGTFILPDDGYALFGEHPFLQEVSRDLARVCHHPDAGQFVLSGWRKGRPCITFPVENGAHGGPGPEETTGFALLPADLIFPPRTNHDLRPSDLRAAALHFLGRERIAMPEVARVRPLTLRIMTYNVHSCVGMDGKISPDRVARVIARYRPDIVALQELDVGRPRTGGFDQAGLLAQKLKMNFNFHPALRLEEEQYGDAVLSRFPMRLVRAAALPRLRMPRIEPRGAIWVEIDADGTRLQLLNTHLGLWQREVLIQANALLGPDWMGDPDCRVPVVLCGDFNALPGSAVCSRLGSRLRDSQAGLSERPRNTWFGRYPVSRIDHIFVSPDIEVLHAEVPAGELEKVSSDHLPLVIEIRIRERVPHAEELKV